jgi:hypothetical protein
MLIIAEEPNPANAGSSKKIMEGHPNPESLLTWYLAFWARSFTAASLSCSL